MVNLSLIEKGGTTNELSFDKGEVTIGRVRGNDIILPKGNVSKHHCRLLIQGNEVLVEDLHSTNGTYVNGRKIAEPTPITTTDKVFVGDFILRLNLLSATMETARPGHLGAAPEAGSLSAAIPRRPPPPPPAARPSMAGDEGLGAGPGHMPLPAPPPPAAAKAKTVPAGEAFPPPSGPSEISLDDDEDDLGTPHPHITVPPLRPVQPVGSLVDVDAGASALAGGPLDERDDERASEPGAAAEQEPAEPAPEPRRPAEPAKARTAPVPAAKAARILDRDVPDWLADLLGGEGVSAAFFAGANQSEVLRNGNRESATVASADVATLNAVVRKLAAKGTPKPAPDAPVINATLPDGMHISAIFPPLTDRLCVAIRRPVATGKTIDDLVAENVISPEMQQVLESCVAARQNILVSGDRAACDSLLRAMLWAVDRMARVVLISDSIAPPTSATSWIKVQAEAQTAEVVTAAVALQPEYLVVDANHMARSGEVLGACSLGMKGAILSLVARSTNEALHRIQVLGAPAGSSAATAGDLALGSIDVVVHAMVLADGSLKVVEIAEPKASLDGQVTSHALLTWIAEAEGTGSFSVTGARSALAAKLVSAGIPMPSTILNQ